MMSWKGFENEDVVAQLRYFPIICLEGLRKTGEFFSHDGRCRGSDSNTRLERGYKTTHASQAATAIVTIITTTTTTTTTTTINNNNNSIHFFILYVLSQQPQGQLQTQHSEDKSSYILDQHNIKSKTN
jgi:hypothetical protein